MRALSAAQRSTNSATCEARPDGIPGSWKPKTSPDERPPVAMATSGASDSQVSSRVRAAVSRCRQAFSGR